MTSLPADSRTDSLNAGCVLVVDDDDSLREMLSMLLTFEGYRVMTAGDGREALATITPEVDAVLLDVRMPVMDGFQVLRELNGRPEVAGIPVLMVTAEALDPESIRRGLELGARDYIAKPLSRPELLARIGAVVRLHRMEQQLRSTNARLAELDHRRREYLAMASHDLKAPLLSVDGYCKLLHDGSYGPVVEDQRAALARIRAMVGYMRVLVSNLLDSDRAEHGILQLEPEQVDVASLIREAMEMHRLSASEQKLELQVNLPTELGQAVVDRQKMLQILNNLVGNALKFCSEGAWVTVEARRVGGCLELTVADTGPGIPLEEQKLLFRPFQQLSVKSTTRERGAGLGLSIVKTLVELHGGTISVDSAPGHGTRFVLSFPEPPAADERPRSGP